MHYFNTLVRITDQHVQKYGAQYYAFAIFGLLNYPIALFYEYQILHDDNGSIFRIVATLLALLLLFHRQWPERCKRFIPLFWYGTLTITIPAFTFYMLFKHAFSLEWLINISIGQIITILLLDWLSCLVVTSIGASLGIVLFFALGNQIHHWPEQQNLILSLYLFVHIYIVSIIFSRNKETFYYLMQHTKDQLNAALEHTIEERTAELEQALAAKTEFLNNISHEIRTPIQGVVSISEGLTQHWEEFDGNKRRQLATQVSISAKRLHNLVGNLLDLSKFSAGKMILSPQKINFVDLAKEMIEECKTLYIQGKHLTIHMEGSYEYWVVADKERLSQVLRNLFTNAIKFSPSHTTITAHVTESDIHYDDGYQSSALHFTLRDQAIGIPEEELEEIFHPFIQSSRTKTKAGGTGLGLAICQEIILAHHGKIWAENCSDGGAAFHFIIPITQEKQMDGHYIVSESEQHTSPHGTHSVDHQATVLLIDDEETCLMSMELLLYGSPYRLIKASGGLEGLRYMREHPNDIDLVLLDLMMPDMYGLNVLVEMKHDPQLMHIPVVLQSGTSDEAEIQKAFVMGVFSYIRKPYQKQTILDEIERALAKK